jgi:hypothetical protein
MAMAINKVIGATRGRLNECSRKGGVAEEPGVPSPVAYRHMRGWQRFRVKLPEQRTLAREGVAGIARRRRELRASMGFGGWAGRHGQ